MKTLSSSIIINVEATEPFQDAKGLRHGDPIPLYLLATTIEYLSRHLSTLVDVKKYKYHPMYKKFKLTHLAFADDLILFSRGDLQSVSALFYMFTYFF